MNSKYWRLSTLVIAFSLGSEVITKDNLQFGRELILEQTAAYKDSHAICVQGTIRNGSRSPIRNHVYAIAYFFGEQSQYLGWQSKQINSQIILPNQTIDFYLQSSTPQHLQTTKVKLKFQGDNSETKVNLYPTNQEKTIINVSRTEHQCSD